MFKTICTTLLLAAAATTATAADRKADRPTLIEVLNADPNLRTLRDTLTAAGLTDAFTADGQFTIFAPSNAAFAAMPEGTLTVLRLPENADRLTALLQYHVDDRRLTSWHLVDGAAYYRPILADHRLCIIKGDGVTIDDGSGDIATVTEANIKASNGVIHLIDKVLVPTEKPACELS